MYVDNEQILGACVPILRQVRAEASGEHTFLTAQQIWIALARKRHRICKTIILLCHRSGKCDLPTILGRLIEALARAPYVETRFLDTRYVLFDPIEAPEFGAGGTTCPIFRLRQAAPANTSRPSSGIDPKQPK
jgi:hypothetical protein